MKNLLLNKKLCFIKEKEKFKNRNYSILQKQTYKRVYEHFQGQKEIDELDPLRALRWLSSY